MQPVEQIWISEPIDLCAAFDADDLRYAAEGPDFCWWVVKLTGHFLCALVGYTDRGRFVAEVVRPAQVWLGVV